MLTLTPDQVTFDGGRAIAEASSLGLRPGEWPDLVALMGLRGDADRGLMFGPARFFDGAAMVYRHPSGALLCILND